MSAPPASAFAPSCRNCARSGLLPNAPSTMVMEYCSYECAWSATTTTYGNNDRNVKGRITADEQIRRRRLEDAHIQRQEQLLNRDNGNKRRRRNENDNSVPQLPPLQSTNEENATGSTKMQLAPPSSDMDGVKPHSAAVHVEGQHALFLFSNEVFGEE